jgi:hypothetical protein
MINEKGFLNENPPILLLLAIFEQGLTGILYLKNDAIQKILYFNRGKFTWALSNAEEDKLENILTVHKHIEPAILNRFTQQAKSSESMGKTLVENGIITLEELIAISKKQLSQIIASILFWRRDTFQFIKDTPPDRLVSLDLNTPEIILAEILAQTDMSQIWKEIGTMQLRCRMCNDQDKIDKYPLALEHKEILIDFHDDTSIEAMIAKFPEDKKNTIVKIIYFYLVTGLLERTPDKPQAEKDALDPFLDQLKNQLEADDEAPKGQDLEIELPPSPPTSEFDSQVTTRTTPPVLEDVPSPLHTIMQTPKKPHRPLFTFLLITFAIVVLGSIILWLLMGDTRPEINPTKPVATPRTNKPALPAKPAGDGQALQPIAQEHVNPKPDSAQPAADPAAQKHETAPVTKPQEKQEKPETKPVQPATKAPEKQPTATPVAASPEAMEAFRGGRYATAADIWLNDITRQKTQYSIMLELDCEKDSVVHAYKNIHQPDHFFILNKKMGSRNCYYVMWGRFTTAEDASRNLASLPAYFRNQKEPPEVMNLAPFYSSVQK